ncbi:MAG: hypothetical protein WAW10_03140 [Gallionella sp.]
MGWQPHPPYGLCGSPSSRLWQQSDAIRILTPLKSLPLLVRLSCIDNPAYKPAAHAIDPAA